MHLPNQDQAHAWLQSIGIKDPDFCLAQAGGSPLLALEANDAVIRADAETFALELVKADKADAFTASAHWGKSGLLMAVSLLQKWVYDLLSAKFYGVARYHPKQLPALKLLAAKADLRRMLDFQRDLNDARGQATHPLNAELQLESLMLRYTQIF